MPDPKPIREMYNIVKELPQDANDKVKRVIIYASKFNPQCIDELQKITTWESLSFRDVLATLLMALSYGISENGPQKKELIDYLKKESTASTSLFRFIRDCNGQQLKSYLLKDEFGNRFKALFADPKLAQSTLDGISTKLGKLKADSLNGTEKEQIETLIDCLISGTDKSKK